jgi:6-pyruvoyltetrahydropterin/6-carboxytetrahydropterin synthase
MDLHTAYDFDAAHRIRGHPGKCAYLHGHTYRLEVTVSASGLDRMGMVMDFDDLDRVVRKAVLDGWDHATLLAAGDPLAAAIASIQAEAPERVVELPGPPTAEVMAREAWHAIACSLPPHVSLERVLIRETPRCAAVFTRVDGDRGH